MITAYGVTGQQRTTSTVYDAASNAVVHDDGLGYATTTAFDAQNRPTTVTDPLSHTSTTAYDANGNVTAVTDANTHTTQYAYDALNRRTTTTDPLSHITTETYDAADNRVTLKDADSNITTFAYDAQNRVTSQTDPLNHTATFAYDGDSHLTSSTDRLSRTNTYSYDAIGRNTGQTQAGGSTTDTLTFTYDAASNQLTAGNGQGTYTMSYDALERVTAVQQLYGVTQTFSYDAAGNRTLVQDSLGGLTTSVYDSQNELTSRRFSGTNQASARIDPTYDTDGRVTGQTRYSDVGGTTLVATTSFTYDNASRLTDEQHKNSSGGNLAHYTYSYDAANQVSTDATDGTITTYSYDADGQLSGDGTNSYNYDATGNRTGTGYGTPTGNELPSDPNWTYSYDNEGNESGKTGISGNPLSSNLKWTYTYDNANHLTSAEERKISTNDLIVHVDYKYDAFGNLVEEDVTQTSTTTTRFAYDGWQSGMMPGGGVGIAAWEVFADLDGSNNLQTRYLHGDATDQLFARLGASNGPLLWLLTDRQGSVREVINNSDTIEDKLVYDGYGNITSETGSSYRGWYAYTGRLFDATTGLQYNRARWYDPTTGRWISQDPLGFNAGDSNLYRYVKNAPADATDPSGLQVGYGGYVLSSALLPPQGVNWLTLKGPIPNDAVGPKDQPIDDRLLGKPVYTVKSRGGFVLRLTPLGDYNCHTYTLGGSWIKLNGGNHLMVIPKSLNDYLQSGEWRKITFAQDDQVKVGDVLVIRSKVNNMPAHSATVTEYVGTKGFGGTIVPNPDKTIVMSKDNPFQDLHPVRVAYFYTNNIKTMRMEYPRSKFKYEYWRYKGSR